MRCQWRTPETARCEHAAVLKLLEMCEDYPEPRLHEMCREHAAQMVALPVVVPDMILTIVHSDGAS
jgi:hypothetical protein